MNLQDDFYEVMMTQNQGSIFCAGVGVKASCIHFLLWTHISDPQAMFNTQRYVQLIYMSSLFVL